MRDGTAFVADRYRLHGLLGEGGMATVHRAYDHQAERWVAIKLLAPALARHLAVQRRFEREAAALQQLNHPNVVQLYDWQTSAQCCFITMEMVGGLSLEAWSSRNGAMNVRQAVEVALQICAGVQAAHDRQIIHRDIKPANVLVAPDGSCKVADFGLAHIDELERLTRTGVTMGTYGYMAPEQLSDASKVTIAADVFSVGATLLALLNGRPYPNVRHALRAVSAQLPLSLSQALVNATLPDPGQRYASLRALERALRRGLRQLPESPLPAQSLYIPIDFEGLSSDGQDVLEGHSFARSTMYLEDGYLEDGLEDGLEEDR